MFLKKARIIISNMTYVIILIGCWRLTVIAKIFFSDVAQGSISAIPNQRNYLPQRAIRKIAG